MNKALTILRELSNQDIWVLLELGLEHTNIDGAISELEHQNQFKMGFAKSVNREEAKQLIYNASKEDKSSPKDCIHLLSLHRFIDQIYDDFEKPNRNTVCLCGSTKFKKEFEEATRQESLKGKIVLSVCQFTHSDNLQISDIEKNVFDELHKQKIDLASEIIVINPNGYIGESTKKEIEYAESKSKTILYLYEQKDKR